MSLAVKKRSMACWMRVNLTNIGRRKKEVGWCKIK